MVAKSSAARVSRSPLDAERGMKTNAHPAAAALDRLIHERVRLAIVSALAVRDSLTFNELKALLKTSDGNLSWGTRRGLPRAAGHRAGVEAVRRMVRAAPDLGITALTLYAFSSDNWSRPPAEVNTLMRLFARYLHNETPELLAQSARLSIIGRRDRLPRSLVTIITDAERATSRGMRIELRIAVDYSAR